jgi:hypothetical protein
MSKQIEFSIVSETETTSQRRAYQSPYGSPETLEFMKDCEAREWITRFQKNVKALGAQAERNWWIRVCMDIEKRRGTEALQDLRSRMNKERAAPKNTVKATKN